MKKSIIGYFNGYMNTDKALSLTAGYTEVLFSFWISPEKKGGFSGAAEAVIRNPDMLEQLKAAGKKCLLAAGGDSYIPTVDNLASAEEYGKKLAEVAIEYGFDGVDFDIENIQISDQSLKWLATATNAFANTKGTENMIISHAPQAPYFNGLEASYATLETLTHGRINHYNIQYYNQGGWAYQAYETYSSLFEEAYENMPNPTSIVSITKAGVPAEKLIIGKPISPQDATNTGFIPVEQLCNILQEAETKKIPFGGVMGWAIDNDTNGEWGKQVSAAVNQ